MTTQNAIQQQLTKHYPSRLRGVSVVMVGVTLLFVGKLFYLQIVQGKMHRENITQRLERWNTVRAQDGKIFDRNKKVLASTVVRSRLVIDPTHFSIHAFRKHREKYLRKQNGGTLKEEVPVSATEFNEIRKRISLLEKTYTLLSEFLGVPREEVKNLIQARIHAADKGSAPIAMPITETMSSTKSIAFRELYENESKEAAKRRQKNRNAPGNPLDGFVLEEVAYRTYAMPREFFHLVGYTQAWNLTLSNRTDEEQRQKLTGIGVERAWERMIVGIPGSELRESAKYNFSHLPLDSRDEEPKNGQDLYLTVDAVIQSIVYKHLKAAFEYYKSEAAFSAVVDPKTGDILAMCSLPGNSPYDYLPEPEAEVEGTVKLAPILPPKRAKRTKAEAEKLQIAEMERCAGSLYEPGSTQKTLTLAAAIETKDIDPEEWFTCMGEYPVDDKSIHDAHNGKHGSIQPATILRVSCNICTAQIGLRLGSEGTKKMIDRFGLREPLELRLISQRRGSLTFKGKDNKTGKEPKKMPKHQVARVAFGQSFATTPLHILMAYAAIANNGKLMKPRLYLKQMLGDRKMSAWEPTPVRNALQPETAQLMKKMLQDVVTSGSGTAAAVKGVVIRGKTGTSEKYKAGKFITSFVGLLPPTKKYPSGLALLVGLDSPQFAKFGGESAAPCFQKIAHDILLYQRPEGDMQPEPFVPTVQTPTAN